MHVIVFVLYSVLIVTNNCKKSQDRKKVAVVVVWKVIHSGSNTNKTGSSVYPFTTQPAVVLGSDAGSNDVKPPLGFVIKNL